MAGSNGAAALRRRAIAWFGVLGLASSGAIGWALASPAPAAALWPNVRVVTPAGITIDGSRDDWDGYPQPGPSGPPNYDLDRLAALHPGGDGAQADVGRLYARYDCASRTLYLRVHVDKVTVDEAPSAAPHEIVRIGSRTVLTAADAGGTRPRFAFIEDTGWEGEVALAPGTYEGVDVETRIDRFGRPAGELAVRNRSIRLDIVCPAAASATPSATLSATSTVIASGGSGAGATTTPGGGQAGQSPTTAPVPPSGAQLGDPATSGSSLGFLLLLAVALAAGSLSLGRWLTLRRLGGR